MSINFDVVIESPENSVDMKAGLDTLQGASEATRYVAEALLTNKLSKRHNHNNKIRTRLKHTFTGSYGHIYSLDIFDEKAQEKFNQIGESVFSELMAFHINEALYLESNPLSLAAQIVLDELGERSEVLIKKLRVSALSKAHETSVKFNQAVKIRHHISDVQQTQLARLTRDTVKTLHAKIDRRTIEISASITRLNINTGNGRLLVEGATETVAFGFGLEYKFIKREAKQLFSTNLDHNNVIPDNEKWEKLRLEVQPLKLRDGKIVKYIIKGFHNA
ncbi:MAG: hypothetical protein ACRC8R_00725 [Aeromonas hydrophila]|uniref:hypothetical protein n=1 Tax=Aeromonas hydrophila TaxID=644 RepID=UPI002B4A150D|nr:hypothetical protein [Aeromonas hydrophila]